jgi:abhydrolase domain-containing protein 12
LTTSDNVRIGAWFVFSDRYYQWHATHPIRAAPFTDSELKEAVSKHPTVIFFHGNAANRAAPYRVTLYSQLSTRLGASVLAIDYRGFGNSDGSPSPEGLALDARAAWNWLLKRGAKPKDIVIMGHSIGTGVAARLAADLAAEGELITLSL